MSKIATRYDVTDCKTAEQLLAKCGLNWEPQVRKASLMAEVQSGIAAEKIRATLDKPYELKSGQGDKAETSVEHHCTASIGVVLFLNHAIDAEEGSEGAFAVVEALRCLAECECSP